VSAFDSYRTQPAITEPPPGRSLGWVCPSLTGTSSESKRLISGTCFSIVRTLWFVPHKWAWTMGSRYVINPTHLLVQSQNLHGYGDGSVPHSVRWFVSGVPHIALPCLLGVSLRLTAAGRAVVLRIKPPAASCPFGLPSLTSSRLSALRAVLALGCWPK